MKLIKDCAIIKIMFSFEEMTRDELIKVMDKYISDLPEDQRATATFKVDTEDALDGACNALFICWMRPETEKECKIREALELQEAYQAKLQDERTETWERRELERLKEKFGE